MNIVLPLTALNIVISAVLGTPLFVVLLFVTSPAVAFWGGYGTVFGVLMLVWTASLMSWRAVGQLVPVGIGTAIFGTLLSLITGFPVGYLIAAIVLMVVWFVGLVKTTARADADRLLAERARD